MELADQPSSIVTLYVAETFPPIWDNVVGVYSIKYQEVAKRPFNSNKIIRQVSCLFKS